MSLLQVPAGKNLPEDIYVIIEISANSGRNKYEVDKNSGILFVDRFMSSTMSYPCNYGYINHTLSSDGDPIDVLVPTPFPLQPGCVIRCCPVGMLNMIDESGKDIKVIAIPHAKLSQEFASIKDIDDLSLSLREQIVHFFDHYKDLENNKWTKVEGWSNAEKAKTEILSAFDRVRATKSKINVSKL
ncbi:inorganic diphosphatase [Sodalis sp. CWE]|uniref:inorganic diphosphatase n=1 Tax=Sodalis sp. CWE TaxID=2803816 RepID=UPI001C7CE455|nr:inorganic diphosphatase [Sodalis sp. CWE]MBX4180798.1 inorganic diphosphatase [Sodalis sp. CWE]